MSNRSTNIIAITLLVFVFVIALASMWNDSTTMDESSHLPAGYSYLTQKDMRINPEHPPLIKDLAALPLLFFHGINFPAQSKDWTDTINGQWGFGNALLFKNGNPVDSMMFWGRIPMVFVLIFLGFFIFYWTRKLYGNATALLALFFFSFSPTFLAHGRLVTTDVGATTGVVIGTYYFLKFLKQISKKNLLFAGIALGIAELAKFSVVLLIPFFGILLVVWAAIHSFKFKMFLKIFAKYLLYSICIGIIAFTLIWLIYLYHTWNYPPERQARDTASILETFGSRTIANLTVWMADKPILRPIAQYLLGVWMVFQRSAGGNTGYFMGEVSRIGWRTYFPIVYLLKEPLAFHVLALLALLYALWHIQSPPWHKPLRRIREWIQMHFSEFAMLLWLFIYWVTSLSSTLNIGIRHLLPIFPFTIILTSHMIVHWLRPPFVIARKVFVGALLLWQAVTVIAVYPSFLAYFNELAGGPDHGYLYVVDSNLDWGQDLKRLTTWVEQNNIPRIYLDYFGGGDPSYYLGQKYIHWDRSNTELQLPKGSYLAVSATFLQGGRGTPVPGFDQPAGYYRWLDQYAPITKIGYSIFVYQIN